MNNLWLIIKREYLTRVTRRSFILATLLTPLAIGLFFVVVSFIFQYDSDDSKRIAVIDEGNIFDGKIKDENNLFFKFVNTDLDVIKDNFDEMDYNGILLIPSLDDLLKKDFRVFYYSDEKLTLDIEPIIVSRIRERVRDYKIDQLQIDRQQLDALNTKIELEPKPIKAAPEETTKMAGKIAAAIGFFMGIIMYMTVFIYGMMVMRSVMEEKTSRIVEVMISSRGSSRLDPACDMGNSYSPHRYGGWTLLWCGCRRHASFCCCRRSRDRSRGSRSDAQPSDPGIVPTELVGYPTIVHPVFFRWILHVGECTGS